MEKNTKDKNFIKRYNCTAIVIYHVGIVMLLERALYLSICICETLCVCVYVCVCVACTSLLVLLNCFPNYKQLLSKSFNQVIGAVHYCKGFFFYLIMI